MDILVDANIYLAVILNEPEKAKIISHTKKIELISPEILPFELGNALSAMLKRKRLDSEKVKKSYQLFEKIPVRLVTVNIEKALDISSQFSIYAYDAYYLEVAQRLKLRILTLDDKMKEIAKKLNISLLEVL